MKCPECGSECDRDSVDVGVGVIHGPYGCLGCGWSENAEYDCSTEWAAGADKRHATSSDFVVDPLGGMVRRST
ncbi:MAG TPA: hypothetical protein VED01_03330 [Burkholderiales bacterium]|nr:hypothetical protein [Burkholderiales bacterium]